LSNTTIEAAEVTTSVDKEVVTQCGDSQLAGPADRTLKQSFVQTTGISSAEGRQYQQIRREADHYLAKIEQECRTRFFGVSDCSNSDAVASIYEKLRVESGGIVPQTKAGYIRINAA